MRALKLISLGLCIIYVSSSHRIHKDLSQYVGNYSNSSTATVPQVWVPISNTPSSSNCTGKFSCLNCTAVRICAPTADGSNLQEFMRFSCPASMPWCNPDTGTCTSSQSELCSAPVVSNFTCMRDGYFPDPNNCSRYYVCREQVAYQYTCQGSAAYYSVVSQGCTSSYWYCPNYNYNCQGQSGYKIGINMYPYNIFVYCVNNTAVLVDRCIGAYQFNQNYQMCVPTCPHAGLFPAVNNCSSYYQCSPASHNPQDNTFIMTNLTCLPGQGFSEEQYQCVDKSLVANCNATDPDLFNKK